MSSSATGACQPGGRTAFNSEYIGGVGIGQKHFFVHTRVPMSQSETSLEGNEESAAPLLTKERIATIVKKHFPAIVLN